MDKELEDLRRQLAESEGLREVQREEQQRQLDEERRRGEEQQRQLDEERRRGEEQQRQLNEERRQREEQQRQLDEERRQREADAKHSQPKNLVDFLRACHNFSLSLQVVTDQTLATKGDTTKPAGRLYPQRIIPWNDFPQQQETRWEDLSISPAFTSQQVYPSSHILEYVQKGLGPISSELGLRQYAHDTVERPVQTVINEIYKDEELRERLQLGGKLIFESHTNLGNTNDNPIEEVEHMSVSDSHTSNAEGQKKKGKDSTRGNNRGITGPADQFCIYELADGRRVPAVLIEYKAPHKLPLAEIIAGLSGEIRPAEDVIDKHGDGLEFLSKSLLAAVITQLFSSMIGKGVQWGYIFTGEATVFLYIPDDPTTVQYHLSIPSLDVQDSDSNRLHRTTVAQTTAFVLNAFSAEPPSQSWQNAARSLDTWAVEYIDILKKIPETARKAPRHSSYKPGNWKGFTRSPIRTRTQSRRLLSACHDDVDDQVHSSSSDEDNDDVDYPSPTPNKAGRAVKQGRKASTQQQGARMGFGKNSANQQDNLEVMSKPRIENRPYCTHQCLLGLASGGVLDHSCPNLTDHGGQHLQKDRFLGLVRMQLAKDRGRDADCKPLFVKGSRGALVKIRLSSHGYTFVAKAMQAHDRQHLLNEAKVYSRLKSLQGDYVPVCLGTLDLELPFYYDYGIYVSMLLLSWAGRSLHMHLTQDNATHVLESVSKILTALHKHQVLHKDPELRNWLWDEQHIMLVDFERASVRERPPLNALSPNRKRNRRGGLKGVAEDDAFDHEIEIARSCIAGYVTSVR